MTFSGEGRNEILDGFADVVGSCVIVVLGSGFACSGWSGGHSVKNSRFWQWSLICFAVVDFALSSSILGVLRKVDMFRKALDSLDLTSSSELLL